MAAKDKTGAAPAKAPPVSKAGPATVASAKADSSSGKKSLEDAGGGKTDKPKKLKMVRDSFTMPENEYTQITELKKKCLQSGVHVKKSELLRAGLALLSRLQDPALLKTVAEVERIKTGRPAKD